MLETPSYTNDISECNATTPTSGVHNDGGAGVRENKESAEDAEARKKRDIQSALLDGFRGGSLWLMTHHWRASTSHGEIQFCRPS